MNKDILEKIKAEAGGFDFYELLSVKESSNSELKPGSWVLAVYNDSKLLLFESVSDTFLGIKINSQQEINQPLLKKISLDISDIECIEKLPQTFLLDRLFKKTSRYLCRWREEGTGNAVIFESDYRSSPVLEKISDAYIDRKNDNL